jgi:hypothetical protein
MYTNSYVHVDLGSRNAKLVYISTKGLDIPVGLGPRNILSRACLNYLDKSVFRYH